jgi:hypothetical protein
MDTRNRLQKFLNGAIMVAWIVFLLSCTKPQQPLSENGIDGSIKGNNKACIDVQGYVLGDISSNATIYLHRTLQLDFDYVMKMVRADLPFQVSQVNDYKEFKFDCLTSGQYVLAIPSMLYQNSTVGSPLPYETAIEYLSVQVIFQGGDSGYVVGVFSINESNRLFDDNGSR